MQMTELADRIRLAADNVGGLKQLSELISVPRRTLGNWLSGRNPKPDHLRQIAKVSNVSLDWLVSGEGFPSDDGFAQAMGRLERATRAPTGITDDEFAAGFNAGMEKLSGRNLERPDAAPAPFLNTELMAQLATVVTGAHREAGIKLSPENVVVEVTILLNELAATVPLDDAAGVTLTLPLLKHKLVQRLETAVKQPGTGKLSAS